MSGVFLVRARPSHHRDETAAALLRRQFLGIGVARCRRPGQFDERHDPPTSTVKLANDEAQGETFATDGTVDCSVAGGPIGSYRELAKWMRGDGIKGVAVSRLEPPTVWFDPITLS
jgi:hypothetical protein